MADADLTVVSKEIDGRVLSGVGVTPEALAETMARHVTAPDPDPVEPPAANEPVPAVPAKEPKGRARFSELTAERDSAKQEADALKARIAALEAQIQAPPTRVADPTPAAPVPAAATPAPFPTFEQWAPTHADQSYEDYILDRARTELLADGLDQRIQQAFQQQHAQQRAADRIAEVQTKARSLYGDFDALFQGGPGAGIIQHPAQIQAIFEHPAAEHLVYQILKDGDLARRLAAATPIQFGLTLGSLASAAPAAVPASTRAPALVTPPAPYQPVGAGSTTTVPASADLAKKGFDFDKSGYRERRAAERGLLRRA